MSSPEPRRVKKKRRGMGCLVTLVILLVLVVAADLVAERVAEGRLASMAVQEARDYDVEAKETTAEIGGFGFLPQVAKGDFSKVTVTMREPTVSAVSAEDLTIVLSDIHVPRAVMTGGRATVTVRQADVRVRFTPETLARMAVRSGVPRGLTFRIVAGKLQARMTVLGQEVAADLRPEVHNNRIRLLAENLPPELPNRITSELTSALNRGVRVPNLPFDAKLKQFDIHDQALQLTASANNLELNA